MVVFCNRPCHGGAVTSLVAVVLIVRARLVKPSAVLCVRVPSALGSKGGSANNSDGFVGVCRCVSALRRVCVVSVCVVLRGNIVNRAYGIPKNLPGIYLTFFTTVTIFGPMNYGPP